MQVRIRTCWQWERDVFRPTTGRDEEVVEINQELLILHRRTGGSAYYKLGCTIKLNVSRHSEIKTGNLTPLLGWF